MAAPELLEWFVYVLGDVTEAAQNAEYTAEYDAKSDETTIVVHAPDSLVARRIAGHFGDVLDWVQIKEAEKA